MKGYILFFKFAIAGLLLFTIPLQSNAQIYEIVDYIKRAASAREHIGQLHNGTLIVRLKSKTNNITALEKALATDKLSDKQRKRLKKKLAGIIQTRDKENKDIVSSLNKFYTFSDYRIVYDKDIHQFFDKKESGYFLNRQLEVDPDISIDLSRSIYILGHGLTSSSDNNRREGLIFTDQNKKPLEGPFPYFIAIRLPPITAFRSFLGIATNIRPQYRRMIERTNKRLNQFYTQAQFKREKDKLREQLKELKD